MQAAPSVMEAGVRGEPGAAERSPDAWDAFVAANEPGSYLQTTAWAEVKAVNGWRAIRVQGRAAGRHHGASPDIGAQILLRRPRPLPWAFAYAPRGPVATDWTPAAIDEFTELARSGLGPEGRVAMLRIDPEVEADGPLDPEGATRRALRGGGWRRGVPVQPVSTRLIDLRPGEDELWHGLRKKWRQYVNRARASGVAVTEASNATAPGEVDPVGEFYAVYRETAERAGFLIRTEQAYRDVWEAFAARGMARLLFARDRDGTALATLFLVRCGTRVVEPYGGMTGAGGDSRANYLLKWEAIRSSAASGAATYDLWGLAHPGIAHFKSGFGGREVRYIGAWDLVLDPIGRRAFDTAQLLRDRWARLRNGLPGAAAPGGAAGYTGDA